jgi:hypothetical protein
MRKKFKYQEDMDIIKYEYNCDCPNKDLKAIISFEAYRYVYEDINYKSNFIPQLKDDPARFIDDNGKKKCDYLNLSMYTKIECAKERYYQLSNSFPNFKKTAGTHIAKGLLETMDGLITNEGYMTHFELYEFENVELQNKFKIIEKL